MLTRENPSVKIVVCYDKKYTHEYKYAKYRRGEVLVMYCLYIINIVITYFSLFLLGEIAIFISSFYDEFAQAHFYTIED